MNVLIVEDERPALENLLDGLKAVDEQINVVATCGSISEGVRWLSQNPQPDLLLMDVQLPDGLSFNIFKSCPVTCPVIFTTAYDEYISQAFEYSSIDFLLKPVSLDRLKQALCKYHTLQHHFTTHRLSTNPLPPFNGLADFFNTTANSEARKSIAETQVAERRKRSRILVRKGTEFQTVRVEDAGYFYTEHKLIFLVDKENRKYMAETSNLSELEEELDNNLFYRANRKYIINANYIRRFKPLERSKISVELTLPVDEEIIISQENSASFKKWIAEG